MSQLRIGLIGGSGLGETLAAQGEIAQRHEPHTPFGRPSDAIIEATWHGVSILLLSRHGPGHLLQPSRVPYRANIYALKQLGCTHVLATGAVGSLREEYKPTDLVIADQIIDRTHRRDGTFFENAAVHVEFAEPFDPVLRRIVLEAAKHGVEDDATGSDGVEAGQIASPSTPSPAHSVTPSPHFTVHDRGCYVAMEGPAFSTRAESLMHRLWGGDLIGMTAMPEAKLAREAEMGYALIALVTDYDCWRQKPVTEQTEARADPFLLLKEIIGNLKTASDNAMTLVRRTVALMAQRREELATSPALRALELAIWSDKTRIPPQEIDRLRVLWGKYVEKPAIREVRRSPPRQQYWHGDVL
ncbi:MAG TPA: MTAP family purine nucleoside phosphorylase [Tepidisphaeraceae bacterium]|nr:MTAP family purine nucleoside phosphorylase [Tepidisphaeraceae bacterium]